MLALRSPSEAYRRVDFDARVAGAGQQQLVALCYEQLTRELGGALHAEARGDNSAKSLALTRALSALTALQLGVRQDEAIAPALMQLYASARRAVLDSVTVFDVQEIAAVRSDFSDISHAMLSGGG